MLADDLVQETLTLGLKNVHQLRQAERLNAWLYSILNNCWKQHIRRDRPYEDLDENHPAELPQPETAVSQLQTVDRVRAAVARLPAEQRRVLALVDLEGMAYSDVAEVMEIPIGTVMSRLHRGRQALIKHFEHQAPSATKTSLRRVK